VSSRFCPFASRRFSTCYRLASRMIMIGARVGKASAVARRAKVEACPPFRMKLPMDGGHGAKCAFCPPGVSFKQYHLQTQLRDLAACLRELYPDRSALGEERVQGMGAGSVESTRVSHTGNTRHSPRNGLRLISCSPRGPGSLAPVVRGSLHDLNASVGASGPHDFAVRFKRARVAAPSASTASRPTSHVRDDRETPL
jgi:hypothetical protein